MAHKEKGFVIFTIDRLNNLITSLYEHLMDDEIEESQKVISETEEILSDLNETISKDEF